MNKHKLNKILKTLPDTFNFKAVFELDLKDKKNTQPHDTTTQKDSKELELLQDIQAIENEWLNFSTNYYDMASKKWVDYTTYWSNRIKEKLKFYGIFISDKEIEALDIDLEFFYEYELDDFIREYKLSKTSKEV
ncbi:hypothetical protein [Helicobacter labetoulli]|uniref:hypothetical protein n=1 Tax=Helicobacter labetoulli TaxID=2315333 RepID=UPI000EF73394|nr:hypothetical protein [Helicobacter labetoulli]